MWKEKYKPDVIIANVENLAHGKGVTLSTLEELNQLGVDCFTSGNHIYKKSAFVEECFEKYPQLIRPANFPNFLAGHGYFRFSKENQQYLVINLNGQVFMENQFDGVIDNPFLVMDRVLSSESQKGDIILVDFHSEATSEKIAMGYYLDGRVAAVIGTHTHVATADARVLSSGTAFITDAGMTGTLNSVIGVKKENVLRKFLNPEEKFVNELEEEGALQVNGVLVEISEDGKAEGIERLCKEI
mgnify:FL=1